MTQDVTFKTANWRWEVRSHSYEAKHSEFASRWRNPLSSFSRHEAFVTQCCLVTLSINNWCRTNDSAKTEFICVAARTTEKFLQVCVTSVMKILLTGRLRKARKISSAECCGWTASTVCETDLLWNFFMTRLKSYKLKSSPSKKKKMIVFSWIVDFFRYFMFPI